MYALPLSPANSAACPPMTNAKDDGYISGERILEALNQAAAEAHADPIKRAVLERAVAEGSHVVERPPTVHRKDGPVIRDGFLDLIQQDRCGSTIQKSPADDSK
jgi:hypothetical protein